MKNSNNNINNYDKTSKWKKSVTLIIVLVTTCSIAAYVGIQNVNGSNEKNINVSGYNANGVLAPAEDTTQESKSETVQKQPVPTKTFNDFSNEYLVNFVTETNTVFTAMRGKRLFEKIEEKDRKLYPLPEPYETIEGFKGVKRNTKTLDFKIKSGELKLNSKCFEDSFLNIDKYPLSNDKAYGIAIAEPTQNAIL